MTRNRTRLPASGGSPGDLRGLTRRDLLLRGGILAAAAGSPAFLAACDVAGDATGSGSTKKQLAIRLVSDIATLDPAQMTSTVEDAVMLCVGENLMTYKAGSTDLVPELAEELTSSKDGRTHTFRLKKGMRFHGDYGEVTAEDVKFSFERIAGLTKPKIDSAYQGDWAALEGVEVTDTHTGVIHLKEPFAPLMLTTIPGNAGIIISRAAYEELGEDFATQPIGSGPFEFERWRRGQSIDLKRFAQWGGAGKKWGGTPPMERISFKPIPEDSAADVAVESGEVDFGPIAHISVDRFDQDDEFSVTKQTTLDYGWVGFNVTDPKLSDVRVRRALRSALDIDAMIVAAFNGNTTRANALLAPDMPIGHWPQAPRYERDLEGAKALLAEAGVRDLAVNMDIQEEPGSRTIAEIVQANLSDIGVNVRIRMNAEGEIFENTPSLQMFYASFSNQADPSWATVWFTSDQIGAWNMMSWSDKEFDTLHAKALTELNVERRHQMYLRMQKLMDEDAVAAWVMYRTHHYAHSGDLGPTLLTPRFGKYRAWTFEV